MWCKQGCRRRTGSATCRVAEPLECPFHTWPWHASGGRACWQLCTEVMLPCITCALGNSNSSAPRRAVPRRPDRGEAPGFVGSCCMHPGGCRGGAVRQPAVTQPAHTHSRPGKSRWRNKGKLSIPVPPKGHCNFPSLCHPACLVMWR